MKYCYSAKQTVYRYTRTYIAVNANAHGRKTHPGMSDFLSVCMCVQWRDVIVTMTVGQQQIIQCL